MTEYENEAINNFCKELQKTLDCYNTSISKINERLDKIEIKLSKVKLDNSVRQCGEAGSLYDPMGMRIRRF